MRGGVVLLLYRGGSKARESLIVITPETMLIMISMGKMIALMMTLVGIEEIDDMKGH